MSEESKSDFLKARKKAVLNAIGHFLRREQSYMISLSELKKMLRPEGDSYVGIKTIDVNKIIGSEGRHADFDNLFLPKNSFLEERWSRVADASINDIILPPIKVYELGGLYFVRDGNHRVSVAKSLGITSMDAEVISLQTEIKLKPVSSWASMLKQIISFEKRNFYFETNFGDITDYWTLDFSSAGQYEIILNHINTHKYYINQDKNEEIPMFEAIESWFKNVYMKVVVLIDHYKVMKKFPHNTEGDLYIWITEHYEELKKQTSDEIPLEKAVVDIEKKHHFSLCRKIKNRFEKLLLRFSTRSCRKSRKK